MPAVPLPPASGRWLWTCRDGFEGHLFEELAWAGAAPRLLGAALVESDPPAGARPGGGAAPPLPAFARQGLPVWSVEAVATGSAPDAAALVRAATPRVAAAAPAPAVVQAFVPDTDAGNRLAPLAEALGAALAQGLPGARVEEDAERVPRDALLVTACLAPGWVALGGVPARDAVSLAPGGRRRMRRGASAPSRAAMKLEEALDGLALEPGRGDTCADLGAAPGGWTERLVARGARVVAVDPARLMPSLAGHRLVRHVMESAFAYEPEEPVDWLFCDMAWRPLEVAQLLAKWGRRGWADQLVANIKLPMHDKNPVLHRVRHVLAQDGGWKDLRVRQLYHDRDEVTVTARRR